MEAPPLPSGPLPGDILRAGLEGQGPRSSTATRPAPQNPAPLSLVFTEAQVGLGDHHDPESWSVGRAVTVPPQHMAGKGGTGTTFVCCRLVHRVARVRVQNMYIRHLGFLSNIPANIPVVFFISDFHQNGHHYTHTDACRFVSLQSNIPVTFKWLYIKNDYIYI